MIVKRSDLGVLAFNRPGNSPDNLNPAAEQHPDRRTQTERRSHTRYQFTATAKVVEHRSSAAVSARSSDISLGGCFIDIASPFPVGTRVRVHLTKENASFQAEANVSSCMDSMGMGLKFTAIEPAQRRVLERWIGELSGELPAEAEGPVPMEAPPAAPPPAPNVLNEVPYVLNDLIIALMRKGILSEEQGKEMLRRLLS